MNGKQWGYNQKRWWLGTSEMSVIDPQDCIFNREKQPNTHWFLEVLALTLFSGEQKKQIDLDHHFTFSLMYYVRTTC